jgi:hypothetical protein
VRFNHYNKPFPVKNLVLRWADVDEEYSFSFVYKGNYRRDVYEYLAGEKDPHTGAQKWGTKMGRDEQGDYFLGLKPGGNYLVTVEEDEEAGIGADDLRLHHGPLKLTSTTGGAGTAGAGAGGAQLRSGNSAVAECTRALLSMDVATLHGEEARRLREARDIEDVLFSGT